MVQLHILKIVAEKIHGDWRKLSKEFGIEVSVFQAVDFRTAAQEKNMMGVFYQMKKKIKWKDLEKHLQIIDRRDIITCIRKERISE